MMNNLTETSNSSNNSNPANTDCNKLDQGIGIGVIGILALISNISLCVVLVRNRQMLKKAYNIIIFTLAVIDTLTGVLMIGLASILVLCLQREESEFRTFAYIAVMTFGKVSVLLVLCLALDRWFAVVQPIRYRYKFTTRRIIVYVSVILTIAASCNIPSALFRGTTIAMYFEITEAIIMVTIPILLTWMIFIHIWVHSKTSPAIQNTAGGKMKSKLLCMCATTAILLTINWLPLQIKRIIDLTQMNGPTSTPLLMIAMANSCVNPWVYYFTNQEYKKEFQKLLPCIAIKCKSKASSSSTIWGLKNIGSIAKEHKIAGVTILGIRNLNQLTIPA